MVCLFQAKAADGGFTSFTERIDAKRPAGGKSFFDHFSQATLFFNSQSDAEKNHIVNALTFELGNVTIAAIRERMLGILSLVDKTLAKRVADGLGMQVPKKPEQPINQSIPADGKVADYQPLKVQPSTAVSAIRN